MYLFRRVINAIRGRFERKPVPKNFTLDVDMLQSLQTLADHEQRTPEEIANQILRDALIIPPKQLENWRRWQTLTPREKEIAALVCLGYTSRQIATKLYISPETVKTHVVHILTKFNVPDRNALRAQLDDWNFSEWDR